MRNYHDGRYNRYSLETQEERKFPTYKGRKQKQADTRQRTLNRVERNACMAKVRTHGTRLLLADFPATEWPTKWFWSNGVRFTRKLKAVKLRVLVGESAQGLTYSKEEWDNLCRYYDSRAGAALREILSSRLRKRVQYF